MSLRRNASRDEDRFQKPIPRRKLKTFTSDAVKSKVKSHDKLKIMELTGRRDLLGRLLYLSAMSDLDLQKVFEYPLMPVSLSLANIDGAMHNTSKSNLARKIEDSVHSSTGPEDINVVMVDAIFFFRTQTERHSTYGEVARCLLSKLVQMAPLVQLICDTYIHPSVKDPERMKRGDSSETVYSITGPNQNVPRDWQKALDFFQGVVATIPINWVAKARIWCHFGTTSNLPGSRPQMLTLHCEVWCDGTRTSTCTEIRTQRSRHTYHISSSSQVWVLAFAVMTPMCCCFCCTMSPVEICGRECGWMLEKCLTIPDATSTSHKLSWRSQTHPCLMRFLDSMPSLAVILQPHSLAKGNSDLWRGWRKSRDALKHLLP